MPKSPADRVKFNRINDALEAGKEISEDDLAYRDNYIATSRGGKSASRRMVNLQIDESAAAEGDHPHPDAYAAQARAEGLRADTLFRLASEAMIQVNNQWKIVAELMMQRMVKIEDAHVAMMEAVRESYLSRTEAEADLIREQAIKNAAGDDNELETLLRFLMIAKEGKEANDVRARVKKKVRKSKPLGSIAPDK